MDKSSFQRTFLLGAVMAVSAFFLWMIHSFLVTLFLAAVFTSLTFPVFKKIEQWTKGRKAISSGITLILFVLVVGIPLLVFTGIVAGQAVKVSTSAAPWIKKQIEQKEDMPQMIKKIPFYDQIRPYSKQILEKFGDFVSRLGKIIFNALSNLTTSTIILFLHIVIMLYAMFFFYIDGPNLLNRILYLMPLEHADEVKILENFKSMAAATIKGMLVIGLVQGFGAGLALGLAGIPSALFWSTIMTILSIIPNIGSVLVWGPAVVIMFLNGEIIKGVLVLLWCGLVVGSADNILRPMLVGKDTKMHELMILLSTIGGIILFGVVGLILGPLVACLFVSIWDIYGEEFKSFLPKVKKI